MDLINKKLSDKSNKSYQEISTDQENEIKRNVLKQLHTKEKKL